MRWQDIPVDIWTEPEPYAAYNFPREMVEANAGREAALALKRLTETDAMVRWFTGRVELVFHGYDDEPRDLWCIPEVRRFVQDLDTAFPYFFWFLAVPAGSMLLLAASCCPTEVSVTAKGKSAVTFPRDWLAGFLTTHFHAVEQLAAMHRLSQAELRAASAPILDFFQVPRI